MLENTFRKLKRMVGIKEKFQWKDGIAFDLKKDLDNKDFYDLAIFHNGVQVGEAGLQYQKANGSFYITNVDIYKEYRGKWFGSQLVEGINSFLDYMQRNGSLTNTIYESKKRNLYDDHGWKSTSGNPDKRMYNAKK